MEIVAQREFKVLRNGSLLIDGKEASDSERESFDRKFPGLRNGKVWDEEEDEESEEEEEDEEPEEEEEPPPRREAYQYEPVDVLSSMVDFRKIPESTVRYVGIVLVALAGVSAASAYGVVVTLLVAYMLYPEKKNG